MTKYEEGWVQENRVRSHASGSPGVREMWMPGMLGAHYPRHICVYCGLCHPSSKSQILLNATCHPMGHTHTKSQWTGPHPRGLARWAELALVQRLCIGSMFWSLRHVYTFNIIIHTFLTAWKIIYLNKSDFKNYHIWCGEGSASRTPPDCYGWE